MNDEIKAHGSGESDRRVILIGMDGLLPGFVKKFLSVTPNTRRLIEQGVFCEALSSMPTDTPTNWTTIATGADTMTHGVRGFPKRPDGKISSYFDSRRCKAEFIWQALERQGKQAILVNYPTSWPVRTKKCTIVGGDGIFSPDWRIGDLVYYSTQPTGEKANREMLFDVRREDVSIDLRKAEGWEGSSPASQLPPLEAVIPSVERKSASWSDQGYVANADSDKSISGHYFVLVTASGGNGYDTVTIASGKNADQAICKLRTGAWSDNVFQDFALNGRTVRGSFRFKLLELSPDAKRLRLYRTMVSTTEGWTRPEGLAEELVANVGPYHEGWENSPMEMPNELGIETLVEHAQMQADWIADASCYLAAREKWDLMMAQLHIQDSYNHRFMHLLEPLCAGYSADQEAEAWKLFEQLHIITDGMVGKIADSCADENTTIILLSDHGSFPIHTRVCIQGILAKAGLLKVNYDTTRDAVTIDQTALDTENGMDDAISILMSIRDPRTGLCPVALALHRDDLPAIDPGQSSVGKLPFFLKAGYGEFPIHRKPADAEKLLQSERFFVPHGRGEHHGLPTIGFKEFSNRAAFIISGAGIAGGKELSHPIALKDVTPTISHLLGIAPPRQSEGRVIREALEAGELLRKKGGQP